MYVNGSGTVPPVLLDGLPEPILVGPLVALEDGFDRFPTTEPAEHLEWQVHECQWASKMSGFWALKMSGSERCPAERAERPERGSWLNVAEVELNVMIRQCLNRRIDSIDAQRAEVAAWQAARDRIRPKVDWQFTTDDACVKLKRLYPTFDV